MRSLLIFFLISTLTLAAISCKKNNENGIENVIESSKQPQASIKEKKILTPEEKDKANSVMYRLVGLPEVKNFTAYTLSLTENLGQPNQNYIVFAPSNNAMDNMSSELKVFYSNQENISKLENLVKSHIVEGELSDENLIQLIKKNGKARLKTLAGTTLTASQIDDVIVLTDEKGGKAKVERIDMRASNGQVFIIDSVLSL